MTTTTTDTGAEDTAADLTISHTAAEGTTLAGDPRPHHGILKANGWRWARAGFWYVPRSRDAAPQWARIHRTAAELAAAGLTVAVEVDEERRSVAEIEQERAERAAERADRLAAGSERCAERADALHARASEMASAIPFGQPILVDHYSAGRDRRYRDRIHSTYGRAFAEQDTADELARRAEAAERTQAHREDVPTTLRRIERLEAERRRLERQLVPCAGSGRPVATGATLYDPETSTALSCRQCWQHVTAADDGTIAEHGCLTGASADRCRASIAETVEQVDYWRAHVAAREDAGAKVWGPGDFTKGDRFTAWPWSGVIVRVNAKTLTFEDDDDARINAERRARGVKPLTRTVAYHKIKTHEPAQSTLSA